MFWLKFIAKFFKALRAGDTPGQVAAGFLFGFLIGLMPVTTLQGIFFWLLLLFLNVNLAAGFVGIIATSLIAWVLDPLFHSLGFFLLVQIPFLRGIWEALYNMPFAPLTKFYNTVVMGSFVSALILATPVYLAMKKFVVTYREKLEPRVQKWKVVQAMKGSALFKWVDKVQRIGDL
ncbi:MAG: TIGR03546 family protein [Deferribacteres bacterium]|nr:TIGR03546 family protein [candidate division KSB1 bacterium]MCB9500955.1 TIGR03546 family protein [Deferribacteres bacterium]